MSESILAFSMFLASILKLYSCPLLFYFILPSGYNIDAVPTLCASSSMHASRIINYVISASHYNYVNTGKGTDRLWHGMVFKKWLAT